MSEQDIYIIEVEEPTDGPPILTLQDFIGKAVASYPEVASMDFCSTVEFVVDKTESQKLYSSALSENSNFFEFLYELASRLPDSDLTN